jgi:hypothetical protein
MVVAQSPQTYLAAQVELVRLVAFLMEQALLALPVVTEPQAAPGLFIVSKYSKRGGATCPLYFKVVKV